MTESGTGDMPPVIDRSLLDRARGVLMGQLTGDALGSQVEFAGEFERRRRFPDGLREIGPSPVWRTIAGQPTDDSEMALTLARTLLRDGVYAPESVLGAYVAWLDSDPFDIGGTIGTALRAARGAEPDRRLAAVERNANRYSQANGALMRQSPLAIWGCHLPPVDLDAIVRTDTRLTHPNPVCQDASAAFIVALAAAVRQGLSPEETHETALAWNREHGGSPAVTKVLQAARDAPPAYGNQAGWVLVALQNAFFQALHAESFEEALVETVMGGGDTDTNAAITGTLLGGIHGLEAIPDRWVDVVLACRPEYGRPGVFRPRPEVYWPVDALSLAEQLVASA